MEKRFKNFDYDLSHNLVNYVSKEFVSLYNHSLILSIAYAYKDPEIIEEIMETIDSLEDPKNLTDNDVIKIEELENMTFDKMYESSNIISDLYYSNRGPDHKLMLHLMFMQILDFFIKGAMHNSIPLDLYLKNLIFNSQGTISMKETILRILQRSSLPLTSKFEVACHYFIDNCFIRNLYNSDKSENEEKYFTANPKFIKDYSLHYWMWQIHGKRKLVTEASTFYGQSDSMWSRADLTKDAAILTIFQKAVEDNNELAVQYLWTNHISKLRRKFEKLGDVLKLASTDPTRINICLYLLFQIRNKGIKNILKCISYDIMKNIFKNKRWHNLSIEIFKALKIYLSFDNIVELLYIICEYRYQYHPRGIAHFVLGEYFLEMPRKAVEKFIANKKKFARSAIHLLDWREKMILIFLINGKLRNSRSFFFSKSGKNFFTILINKGKYDLLEDILDYFNDTDEGKICSISLSFQKVFCLCRRFIKSRRFKTVFSFINWWSSTLSTDQVESFKNEIIQMNKSKLGKIFVNGCQRNSNSDSVNDLNLFMFWYFGLKIISFFNYNRIQSL